MINDNDCTHVCENLSDQCGNEGGGPEKGNKTVNYGALRNYFIAPVAGAAGIF